MREGTKATTSRAPSYIIKRPRLTKLLDESGARLILLLAPAGYGKTTLAREWTAGYRRPVAWYQAARASADVAALATGLALELDTAADDGETVSLTRMASLAAYQQRPDVLASALAKSRSWPAGLIVVIDDYHHLAGSDAAEEFVGQLTTLVPAAFVIASRARPSWFTPRQAVYGEAFEIGTAELTMTVEETTEVFAGSPAAVAAFEAARGWPVVIGLAARTGRTEFPRKALPRRLYEYLADDLIQATSAKAQQALTILALSGTKDRALARTLIGAAADAAMSEAETRGLLVTDDAERLTLHPLLAEYLIEKLREASQSDTNETLKPMVARLMQCGRWDECLNAAEALPESCTFAVQVLEKSLQELLLSGRVATVRRWVAVAREISLSDPVVELAEGEATLRAGEYDRALALGSRAADRFQSGELCAQAALVAGRAAHLTDRGLTALRWFATAEEMAKSPSIRAEAIWGQFIEHDGSESGDLQRAFGRLVENDDGTPDHDLRLALARFHLEMAAGRINDALENLEVGIALLPNTSDPFRRLSALNQYAGSLCRAGRYEEALVASGRLIADAQSSGIDFPIGHALVTKASALIGLRRFALAQRTCAEVTNRLREETEPFVAVNLAIQHARLYISLNDLRRASARLTVAPKARLAPASRGELDAYRALIAAASNRTDEAAWLIERSMRTSRTVDVHSVARIARAILQIEGRSLSSEALGDVAFVLRCGHYDAIVIGCRVQPKLATVVARDKEHRETLVAILTSSNDGAVARSAGLHIPKSMRRADALSPRELEVYELMIQGHTNGQIAKNLFISESTTKVHVRHIFEKLGVRSRVEAVRAWLPTDESH